MSLFSFFKQLFLTLFFVFSRTPFFLLAVLLAILNFMTFLFYENPDRRLRILFLTFLFVKNCSTFFSFEHHKLILFKTLIVSFSFLFTFKPFTILRIHFKRLFTMVWIIQINTAIIETIINPLLHQ